MENNSDRKKNILEHTSDSTITNSMWKEMVKGSNK